MNTEFSKFFATKRQELQQQIGAGNVAVIATGQMKIRSNDTHYSYRQDSDFGYLSDFHEPNALLVLQGGDQGKQILFLQNRDPAREQWDGFRLGPERACETLGVDFAHDIADLESALPQYLTGKVTLLPGQVESRQYTETLFELLRNTRQEIDYTLHSVLHEMRLFKGEVEIDWMRTSATIAAEAHTHAMRTVRPGMMEYQLEAEYTHYFRKSGASGHAYSPIVGGGNNACILHYDTNNDELADGDLVLVDAGCEYNGYASDITRTFPVGRTMNGEQRALYDVVLQCQESCIEAMKPGTQLQELQDLSERLLADGLRQIGMVSESADEQIVSGSIKRFYMHGLGHFLGRDVHDVGSRSDQGNSDSHFARLSRRLEPGMVMTCEPGVYILDGMPGIDSRWHGIGIRIEDDILITKSGNENLTAAVPRTIDEIEALRSG